MPARVGVVTFPVSVALLTLILFVAINAAIGRICWRWATRKRVEKVEGTVAAPLIITG